MQVPLRCINETPLDLGGVAVAPPIKDESAKKRRDKGAPIEAPTPPRMDIDQPPVTMTLWRVGRAPPVKHLFILQHAESSLGEAYRTVMRAAGLDKSDDAGGGAPSDQQPSSGRLSKLRANTRSVGAAFGSPRSAAASLSSCEEEELSGGLEAEGSAASSARNGALTERSSPSAASGGAFGRLSTASGEASNRRSLVLGLGEDSPGGSSPDGGAASDKELKSLGLGGKLSSLLQVGTSHELPRAPTISHNLPRTPMSSRNFHTISHNLTRAPTISYDLLISPTISHALSSPLQVGGDALHRLREAAKRTDHPLSAGGWAQAKGLRSLLADAVRLRDADAMGEASTATAAPSERVEDDGTESYLWGGSPSAAPAAAPSMTSKALLEVSAKTEASSKTVASMASDAAEEGRAVTLVGQLLGVGAIWSSPLARCVQTAMLALQPLTHGGATPIELKPTARERRELTNLHTSIGNSCGEHIRTRCLAKLREVSRAEDEGVLAEVEDAPIATAEVEAQWWSTNPEPEKEYMARIDELLTQLQYSPHDSILLVAHSDTLQELLRSHLHEDARETHAELVAQLASKDGAPPCSLVCCTLDFRRGNAKPITDLALLGDALRKAGGRPR